MRQTCLLFLHVRKSTYSFQQQCPTEKQFHSFDDSLLILEKKMFHFYLNALIVQCS